MAFGAAIASLLVSTIVVNQSSSALEPQGAIAGNSFQVGTIALSDDDEGQSLVNLADMMPGHPAQECIELTYDGRECRDQVDVSVEEGPDEVVVTVTERVRTLVCGDDEVASYDVSVELDEPLGDRELVDGACGLGQFTQDERCDADLDPIAG